MKEILAAKTSDHLFIFVPFHVSIINTWPMTIPSGNFSSAEAFVFFAAYACPCLSISSSFGYSATGPEG